MVLIPERMAILDTERALEMFDALGLQMAGLIVNQVYPAELADAKGGEATEFLRNRVLMQRKYLDEIRSKFAGKVVRSEERRVGKERITRRWHDKSTKRKSDK